MTTLNSIKSRLEREVSQHAETRSQLDDMASRLMQFQQLVDVERAEREKLAHAVSSGSLPDDAKVGLSSSTLMAAVLGKPQLDVSSQSPVPPPPGAPPLPGCMTSKKNIPQSKQPMKSFNWAKLPDSLIKTTIWQDIDDTRVFHDFVIVIIIYYRTTAMQKRVLATRVLSTRLSVVRLHVRRLRNDKMKESSVRILIPKERPIPVVF